VFCYIDELLLQSLGIWSVMHNVTAKVRFRDKVFINEYFFLCYSDNLLNSPICTVSGKK